MIHLKMIKNSLWVVFLFAVFLSTFSFAAPCSVCGENPAQGELTLRCSKGHLIDSTCLNNQITSL